MELLGSLPQLRLTYYNGIILLCKITCSNDFIMSRRHLSWTTEEEADVPGNDASVRVL